jgi:hypothetical protein
LVVERFSLRAAALRLLELYEETLASPSTRRAAWAQGITVGGRAMANEVRLHDPRGKSRRHADREARLAAAAEAEPSAPPEGDSSPAVLSGGVHR